MSARAARRLAWSAWAVAVLLAVATAVLLLLAGDVKGQNAAFDAVLALVLLTYPTVGAVIATRQPGNAIGWLFCAVGVPFALTSFCYAYATYALRDGAGVAPGRRDRGVAELVGPVPAAVRRARPAVPPVPRRQAAGAALARRGVADRGWRWSASPRRPRSGRARCRTPRSRAR